LRRPLTRLRHLLLDLIDDQSNLDVVIDLRHADVIDLTGVELVVDAHERMRRKGGRLVLSEPWTEVSAPLTRAGIAIGSAQREPLDPPSDQGNIE